jgi:hypothetical protein
VDGKHIRIFSDNFGGICYSFLGKIVRERRHPKLGIRRNLAGRQIHNKDENQPITKVGCFPVDC